MSLTTTFIRLSEAVQTVVINGGSSVSYAVIVHTAALGSAGGTYTNGAWRTRPLTSVSYDPDGIVTSLLANQFVLEEGAYVVSSESCAYSTNSTIYRLQNITDASTVIRGINGVGGANGNTSISLVGAFNIASPKTFELQMLAQTTVGTFGMGLNNLIEDPNIFTVMLISKVG